MANVHETVIVRHPNFIGMKLEAPTSGPSAAARRLKPRDAATLIIIDRASGEPRVLMGRRRMDQVFMPGKYVFPGGRVDPTDRKVPVADELRPAEAAKLGLGTRGAPALARARALALAAIRETFEESGIIIGARAQGEVTARHESWRAFLSHGFLPALSALTFFARAITPPGRPRRYDTRFFSADATAIAHRADPIDEELQELRWLTFEEARAVDLPAITRVILDDLTDQLDATGDEGGAHLPVPFYHHRGSSFRRDLLALPRVDGKPTRQVDRLS